MNTQIQTQVTCPNCGKPFSGHKPCGSFAMAAKHRLNARTLLENIVWKLNRNEQAKDDLGLPVSVAAKIDRNDVVIRQVIEWLEENPQ